MNFKKLGNTEVDVSTICLGTMTWGEQNSNADGFEQMYIKFREIQPFCYKCNNWCYEYATVENKYRKCKCKIK